ncbi:DUF4429 domain-containing protein [Streptomyces rimosus]|uniref:DUF4429 domain-containing protein n=1 Tax=Streptomyces rimosus TaxID=1927 RepID=UPI001F253CD6|nr:DUF4429 domain-containing protein [Streptomyces rimosus]
MIHAKGQGGQITFGGQNVTITREGLLGRATHGRGDKRICITSVSAVQWKPAGAMVNGFIQLSLGDADRQAGPEGLPHHERVQGRELGRLHGETTARIREIT